MIDNNRETRKRKINTFIEVNFIQHNKLAHKEK